MNSGPITVLIVDDHPVVRSGLRALLETAPRITVTGEGTNGQDAIRLATELAPHVIIMDLHMPILDGISATRQILQRDPTIAILALTMLDDDDSIRAALHSGARGYILKGAEPGTVVRAIENVAAGEAVLGPSVALRLARLIHEHPTPTHTTFRGLTQREFEVLQLLATGASNTTIGQKLRIRPKTVRNHVSNVLTKLGAADRIEAILIGRNATIGHNTQPQTQEER